MRLSALAAIVLLLAGCDLPPDAGLGRSDAEFAKVDQARLEAAESDPDNWLGHGRTYAEQRFSPLDQVNDSNVGELGLAEGRKRPRSWSTGRCTSRPRGRRSWR